MDDFKKKAPHNLQLGNSFCLMRLSINVLTQLE